MTFTEGEMTFTEGEMTFTEGEMMSAANKMDSASGEITCADVEITSTCDEECCAIAEMARAAGWVVRGGLSCVVTSENQLAEAETEQLMRSPSGNCLCLAGSPERITPKPTMTHRLARVIQIAADGKAHAMLIWSAAAGSREPMSVRNRVY